MTAASGLMRPSPEELLNARVVWDYMFLRDEPATADVIIGLGCHDLSVANDAAKLYERGVAPIIVFAGDVGRMTIGMFDRPEAQMLKERAITLGVPEKAILLEQTSRNTGENIVFTQRLLEGNGLRASSVVLVHKQYMLRRDYATFMKQWKGAAYTKVVCWAENIGLDEFLAVSAFDPVETIHVMVGDLQRVMVFPDLGYQIPQHVPADVRQAYEGLVRQGYTRHLTREHKTSV